MPPNARVDGERVMVTLRSHNRQYGSGAMTGINTQFSGRLGQWLQVGGVEKTERENRRYSAYGDGYRGGSESSQRMTAGAMELMVERLGGNAEHWRRPLHASLAQSRDI